MERLRASPLRIPPEALPLDSAKGLRPFRNPSCVSIQGGFSFGVTERNGRSATRGLFGYAPKASFV